MGTNVRPLTVSSVFLVALVAVAALGFMATPRNGTVKYLAITDSLNNKIGVEIIITDPDKIAQWSVFKGLEKPGMHNQETWSPEDCDETTVTVYLNGRAHLTHDHVVTYVDCEENPHSDMFGIQVDTLTGYPTDTTSATRVSFGDGSAGDDDTQHGMLLERNLFWTQVAVALVALTLLLTLVVVFRSRSN